MELFENTVVRLSEEDVLNMMKIKLFNLGFDTEQVRTLLRGAVVSTQLKRLNVGVKFKLDEHGTVLAFFSKHGHWIEIA